MYRIKEVADLLGISVRMLHHYNKIDLIKPESFTEAGYRLYSDDNLSMLQQVLFFRELNFSLQEIKEIINNKNFNQMKALETHKTMLKEKIKKLEKIIETVDKTINSIKGGAKMDKKEMFETFDMTDIEKHQKEYYEETKINYGHTKAYQESQKKTAHYTKKDWKEITEKGTLLYKKLASLITVDVKSQSVQTIVDELRNYISTYFYDCTIKIFQGLGQLYVTDPRFTKNIDQYGEGLAEFLKDAIDVYCEKRT